MLRQVGHFSFWSGSMLMEGVDGLPVPCYFSGEYLIYLFTMYVLTVLFLYWLGRFLFINFNCCLILLDSYTVKCKLNHIHSYQCFS